MKQGKVDDGRLDSIDFFDFAQNQIVIFAMQKWEYMVFQATLTMPLTKLRIAFESEDRDLVNALEGKNSKEALDYMGEQGWELVTVSSGLRSSAQIFYFKRPKLEQ